MQLFHLLHSGHTAGSPAGTDRFQHGALLGLDLVLIDLEVSREQVTDGSSRAEKVFVFPKPFGQNDALFLASLATRR